MAEIPREMLVKYILTNIDLGESEISEVIKKIFGTLYRNYMVDTEQKCNFSALVK